MNNIKYQILPILIGILGMVHMSLAASPARIAPYDLKVVHGQK